MFVASRSQVLLLPLAGLAQTKADLTDQSQPVSKELNAASAQSAPDLVVSTINMSPGKPTTNDKITVWTFVKNAGPAASPQSSLQLQIGGKIYPLITVPALPVNKDWRHTVEVEPLTAGNYQITAIVMVPQKRFTV